MLRLAAWLGLVSLSVLACVPVQVTTAVDPEVDWSRYRTYVQARPEADDATAPDSLPGFPAGVAERIESAIDTGLESKGYRRGDPKASQLMVSYLVTSDYEVRLVNAADPDTDYRVPKRFRKDELVISFFDTASGARVWQGTGEVETMVGGAIIGESAERSVVQAAHRVLEAFPRSSSLGATEQ